MNKKDKKVGMGVIGCGSIAWLGHFSSIKAIPELELVAVCDSNEEYACKVAGVGPLPRLIPKEKKTIIFSGS